MDVGSSSRMEVGPSSPPPPSAAMGLTIGVTVGGLNPKGSKTAMVGGGVGQTGGRPGSAVPRTMARTQAPSSPALMTEEHLLDLKLEAKQREEATARLLAEVEQEHEGRVELLRKDHRDAVAEAEGEAARLAAEAEAAVHRAEQAEALLSERSAAVSVLREELQVKLAAFSADSADLQAEEDALKRTLAEHTARTEELGTNMAEEQEGARQVAEEARREGERKAQETRERTAAAEELVAVERNNADALRREEEASRAEARTILTSSLGQEAQELRRALAEVQQRAATEVSRAQSDADAACQRRTNMQRTRDEIVSKVTVLKKELDYAAQMTEWNSKLHHYISRETERRKKLHNDIEDMKGKIRVYVRTRPMSKKEHGKGCKEAVKTEGKQTITVNNAAKKEEKSFDFDQVFAGSEEDGNNQVNIFKDTGYLVTSSVDGYNVCIFAYGQTGSGKTYTMFGAGGIGGGVDTDKNVCDNGAGVTPRAVLELFRVLKERESQYSYVVKVSLFELYRDGLRDLLAKRDSNTKLVIKLAEHSGTGLVVVEGGVELEANSPKAMIETVSMGAERRAVSSTQMNADSSRSHLICSMVVTSTHKRTGRVVRGKLTLVDLAGSERVGKSGASGDQLKEAQSINKSLSALGDVIGALTSGSQHIPYRNHPLTMMMSDSLGGNAKTLMFVCASPADYNAAETINALQFAARCKDVTNSVGGGSSAMSAQVAALKRELIKLKEEGEGPKRPAQLARPG